MSLCPAKNTSRVGITKPMRQALCLTRLRNKMKHFLNFCLTFLFLLCFWCVSFAAESKAPRWNVLFVFADDWGRYAGAYAKIDQRATLNDVIKTPHIDRVAQQGILFRNAFVNSPSCTPSRSALMTGRYFFNTGPSSILHGAWDYSLPSYPLMLREGGYHIGKSYKVWGPGNPSDAPFGGQKYAYQKGGPTPNNFSEEATKLVAQGKSTEAARTQILQAVRRNFDDFLKDRKPGQPWHYFFGPTTTHRTWVKGSGKSLWGINPDDLRGKMPKFLPDVPEVREDVSDYLGECQALDAYVGALMQMLEESGDANNTLVVLSGDHGMPGVPSGKCNLYDMGVAVPLIIKVPKGKGNRVIDDMVCLPDLAPTFMEIGGSQVPENLYGRSLLPLLQKEESGVIDKTRNWVITGRERHVQGAREGNLPYPMRSLRTREWVYVKNFASDRWPMGSPDGANRVIGIAPDGDVETNTRATFADMDAGPTKAWLVAHKDDAQWKWYYDWAFGKRPREELYDVKNDPDQIHNLAENPKFSSQKKFLSQRLMQLLTQAGDPRVVNDGTTFDREPFTTPAGRPLAPLGKSSE